MRGKMPGNALFSALHSTFLRDWEDVEDNARKNG
jgi:hypothetical protein